MKSRYGVLYNAVGLDPSGDTDARTCATISSDRVVKKDRRERIQELTVRQGEQKLSIHISSPYVMVCPSATSVHGGIIHVYGLP